MSLTQKLLKEHKNKIESFTLLPSSGGVFEVKLGDLLVFSKAMENRKPNPGEVEQVVRETLSKV